MGGFCTCAMAMAVADFSSTGGTFESNGANLPAGAVVADVGTGTGFVLQGLVQHAAELVGFDESPEMLAVARKNLAEQAHVTFQLTDGKTLPVENGRFDAVFANMYLHHTPDPAAAVSEMVLLS